MRWFSRAVAMASAALLLAGMASASGAVTVLPSAVHLGPIQPTRPGGIPADQRNSFNWSGYGVIGTTFQAVTGAWTQPAVDCSVAPNGIAVFWVGLDGYSSPTVEQDGTVAECQNGVASYYDWWEMYPTNSAQIVNPISVGDAFTSSVTFTAGRYVLTVTDHTHPASSFTRNETCGNCQRSSAEWIAEAPCCLGNGDYYPLPDWGRIKFAKSLTTDDAGHTGTISDPAWQNTQIFMVNKSGQILARPGSLKKNGKVFTVTWKQAQ